MKSVISFVAVLLLSFQLSAQSTRLILFEEFTSASCYWCGVFNPAFQTLLNNNSTKCTSIKYQSNFGYDPMYDHNPTESGARGSYYAVPGYPDCVMDGNQFHGSPSQVNQTKINNRYAIPSPFEITINQQVSDDEDSIYVTALIKATQAVSGNFVAHLVVIEKHIHFNTPPGTNGEKDFYNVMKKMLPGSTGTSLPASWEVGDYVLISESWKLANVYKISELSVVGFVQNNTTKEVMQAANTTATPITALFNNDAQLTSISGLLDKYCINAISPSITIRNNGNHDLTSLDIRYKVNNSDESLYQWTGNLSFLEEAVITLPAAEFQLMDNNVVTIYTSNPGNVNDEYPGNDTLYYDFTDAVQALTTIKVLVRTDTKPGETTWEIKDQNGVVFAEGGPYTQPNKIYSTVLSPGFNTCYDFFIYDAGGDGILNGFYSVYSPIENDEIILGGGTVTGSMEHFQFFGPSGVSNEIPGSESLLTLYPNPVTDLTRVLFTSNKPEKVEGTVTDASGRIVVRIASFLCTSGKNEFTLAASGLQKGIYFVNLRSESGEIYTTKLIKK